MSTNQYVILTGSKNNAGDFFIKRRAEMLFRALRSDRAIIDYDAWNMLRPEQLKEINNSKCLILVGGPALQPSMYPAIYPLVEDLTQIKVPIITMGIGWKSLSGNWGDTYKYPLSAPTRRLLDLIESSGYTSSVRDYHSLNVLQTQGYNNFKMTGCPGLYELDHIERELSIPEEIKKIGFSLGVSFIRSEKMKRQMQQCILNVAAAFPDATMDVVFHHSTQQDYLNTHNASSEHLEAHLKFIQWLESENINHIDISGSAENLIGYYTSCDVHIGYRVHAHIFMSSLSKMSILISEDGRGKGLRGVISGLVFDGFSSIDNSFIAKLLSKIKNYDRLLVLEHTPEDITSALKYELANAGVRVHCTRKSIDKHFNVMKAFIQQLP